MGQLGPEIKVLKYTLCIVGVFIIMGHEVA